MKETKTITEKQFEDFIKKLKEELDEQNIEKGSLRYCPQCCRNTFKLIDNLTKEVYETSNSKLVKGRQIGRTRETTIEEISNSKEGCGKKFNYGSLRCGFNGLCPECQKKEKER